MDAARTVKAGQVELLETIRIFEPKPEGYAAFFAGLFDSPDPKVRYAALGSLRPMTRKRMSACGARAAAMLRDPVLRSRR
jgi:hypothetical protein